MTNELLALFEYYEKEKGIKRDTMVEALETALLSASRKSIGPAREMRIHIDPENDIVIVLHSARDDANNAEDWRLMHAAFGALVNATLSSGDESE